MDRNWEGGQRDNAVSNPRPQGNRENLLGKKSGSRSGSVQYGSNTNSRREGNNGAAFRIDRAPLNIKRGSLGSIVRRSDHDIQVNGVRIRFGYTQYDRRWCDDYFYYPHYVFDPCQTNFVFSPFYYYAHLPAYFNYSRCYFPGIASWQPFYGVRYRWNQPSRDYWNRDYNELDYVVDDITRSFRDGDRRALNRLIPRRGNVGIVMDGVYQYALRPDDFYDTMLDAVENSRTFDYQILDVQYRRDTASIFARHDFEDPWGRRTSVFHYFKLEVEGRDWVIREFGTNQERW